MVKESIINLKKALSNSLQTVPNLIEVLKRGLDGVETAAEEESTYSTNERVVGKWIDGSDIYEKTISFGALPNTSSKSILHNITNIGLVIEIKAITNNETLTTSIPIPSHSPGISIIVSNTAISITTASDRTGDINTYVTLKYLKIATNRTPENDTKNDGDEEKNTDER